MPPIEVMMNSEKQQFEAPLDGQLAFLQYQLLDSQLILIHTEVPSQLEGRGAGAALAKAALEYARQNRLAVIPLCSFVRAYLTRHPEYQDLVEEIPGKDLPSS